MEHGSSKTPRTQTIFSPTQVDMIQKNQPNACNLCHLDKPIDWTLDQLKSWFGRTYDDRQIGENYPKRNDAVGWGRHPAGQSECRAKSASWKLTPLSSASWKLMPLSSASWKLTPLVNPRANFERVLYFDFNSSLISDVPLSGIVNGSPDSKKLPNFFGNPCFRVTSDPPAASTIVLPTWTL